MGLHNSSHSLPEILKSWVFSDKKEYYLEHGASFSRGTILAQVRWDREEGKQHSHPFLHK